VKLSRTASANRTRCPVLAAIPAMGYNVLRGDRLIP
jgi:hypothetical protein